MAWKWLNKLLGKKHPHEKHPTMENASLHTMGPEELLDSAPVDMEEGGKYTPIEGIEHHSKHKQYGEDTQEELEPILEVEQPSENKTEIIHHIEAALFMSSKGMNVEDLAKIANAPLLKVRAYIPETIESFNKRNKALEIVEDAGGFRMKVRPPYDERVSHLAGASELSPAELKTLAFIAYKQPLLQSQLVQVRSNTAYDHLQVLVDKGFVAREPKGRSFILRTTKKFSEYFGTHALKLKPMPKNEENTVENQ
jgi:segregation and condensation protein B